MNARLQANQDLFDDFEEIIYLLENYLNSLYVFKKEIRSAEKFIAGDTFVFVSKNLNQLIKQIDKYRNEANSILKADINTQRLRNLKYKYQDLIRTCAELTCSIIISTDWQSPSFAHSLRSNSGRQTGKITGTINDYKRDVHLDEKKYEELFLKEYIDAKFKFFLKAYLVNSGQAAFQTILTYLQSEAKIRRKVMTGQSSYFQYKQILQGTFGRNLTYVNELSTDNILDKIRQLKPSVIFLDSLSNSSNLAVPDLKRIMGFIYKNVKEDTYIVIDNTCLSVDCQPFLMRKRNNRVHLICFESLNKYHQFGLDRVTAGIIVCENHDTGGIFEYRKHAGTNITDSSVFCLPLPNRKLLSKRLERHKRNAKILSNFLNDLIETVKNSKIEKIIYPGIGSFFNIQFEKKYNSPKMINNFIKKVIDTAKKEKVNIIGGTSFGLNTTRIYLTSLWSKYGTPFLRVSPGTEDLIELEKIKTVFLKTLT